MTSRSPARVRSDRDLIAWQKALALASECLAIARALPLDDRGDIGRKLRRSALAIPANIAEGAARRHRADYARFLAVARGSQAEVMTYLEIVRRERCLAPERVLGALDLACEVGRLLSDL